MFQRIEGTTANQRPICFPSPDGLFDPFLRLPEEKVVRRAAENMVVEERRVAARSGTPTHRAPSCYRRKYREGCGST
jgi:hypothetical protein